MRLPDGSQRVVGAGGEEGVAAGSPGRRRKEPANGWLRFRKISTGWKLFGDASFGRGPKTSVAIPGSNLAKLRLFLRTARFFVCFCASQNPGAIRT